MDEVEKRKPLSAEHARLEDSSPDTPGNWKAIGPYVSERAWGTVREDYSADGSAWTPLGSIVIPMRTNVYIVLAVTAHTNLVQTTAVIDQVLLSGPIGDHRGYGVPRRPRAGHA